MRGEFMTIADVLGRHDRGAEVLERMDRKIAEGWEVVKASGATGQPFALLMGGT